MAGRSKDSSLLFSANISSPFDNISSTPILCPPVSEAEKVEDDPSIRSHTTEPVFSLQPHLNPNLNSAILPEQTLETCAWLNGSERASPNIHSATTLPPPIISASVGSFLRRPTNKYVVPQEINATPMPPQLLNFSPTPTFPLTGNVVPCIPSNSLSFSDVQSGNCDSASSVPAASVQSHNKGLNNSYEPFLSPASSAIIPTSFDEMASNPPLQSEMYHSVMHHWFYTEGQQSLIWKPFSFTDSLNLEDAFREGKTEQVATEGGRYDVNIIARQRVPIYWDADPQPVMRCSWFRRTYSGTYPIPFSEEAAEKLEAEYRDAVNTSVWQRLVDLSGNERVMINSPSSMFYYQIPELMDIQTIASPPESNVLLSVRRGTDDFMIKEGASEQVDHLLFLIHGIGSVCDLSFRSVEECVDDFRTMGEDLLSTHFKEAIENGKVGRVEILPISWHKALHGDATGLDAKLKHITLRSIPKFREFTNDTLLDILFYTSPVYCQHIMDTVSSEMERLLALFGKRNPNFNGSVSVGGHSLGSVILFDLLMHQNPILDEKRVKNSEECKLSSSIDSSENNEPNSGENNSSLTSQIDFQMGVAGTGQPLIIYPQLSFKPKAFFLMGSPVGMFITVRGIDNLGPSFKLPTCDRVFNIFHPFDPVAYRIETLIDTSFEELRPVLVPHHKGRKRMHLELKDTIERVGSDIKNKIVDSIQSTWNRFYQLYTGSTAEATREEVDQALEEHINRLHLEADTPHNSKANTRIGELNRGERIDYVLQEKPYESLTEYIFALQAHVSYWKSEDTLLLILKELYKLNDVNWDQPSLTQHTVSSPSSSYVYSRSKQAAEETVSEVSCVNTNQPITPVPLLSNNIISSTTPLLPQSGMSSQQGRAFQSTIPSSAYVQAGSKPRTLRGRPVFDPSAIVTNSVGMDPTVSPTGGAASLPPPPILPNVCFSKKKQANSDIY